MTQSALSGSTNPKTQCQTTKLANVYQPVAPFPPSCLRCLVLVPRFFSFRLLCSIYHSYRAEVRFTT